MSRFDVTKVFSMEDFKIALVPKANFIRVESHALQNGVMAVRGLLDNGIALYKKVLPSGTVIQKAVKIPPLTDKFKVARELYANGFNQEDIACAMGISQGTVSRLLGIKKKL